MAPAAPPRRLERRDGSPTLSARPGIRDTALEVGVVPIPVLVISVGKVSVPLAVGDSTEGRVIVEAGVEDLVHDLLRLLPADVPHC